MNSTIAALIAPSSGVAQAVSGYLVGMGDGVTTVFTAPPEITSLTSLYRRDWQGCVALSPSARTNLIKYSEQADNWTKGTGVTVTADAVTGPDGESTADALFYDGSGVARAYRLVANPCTPYAPVSGDRFTVSVWMRAAVPITLQMGNNITPKAKSTCNVTSVWQRFTCNLNNGDGTSYVQLAIYNNSGDNAPFTVYVAKGQIEDGIVPTSYIPTTTAPVTVTDYAATGNTITLAEAPVRAAEISLDGTATGLPLIQIR